MPEKLKSRWRSLERRRPSVRRAVAAWERLQEANGNQYAAAITYFSFLALFPLLLLAVAVVGFVLAAHPHLQQELFSNITAKVPGEFGRTLRKSITAAVDARAGVGIIGLAGVLLTGLGWIGNLRAAIDAVMGSKPRQRNFVMAKVSDAGVLAGLGLGMIASIGLTALGTSLTDQLVSAVGLDTVPGVHAVLKIVGIAVAIAADVILFLWLLAWLPDVHVPRGIALRAALLASLGFEVLKIVGTYTIAHTANSPTSGPFAGLLAVLIWIQLVARWLLFCAAWMTVLCADRAAGRKPPAEAPAAELAAAPGPAGPAEVPELNPAALGVTLVGAGALAGAAATWWITTREHQGENSHSSR